MLLLISLMLCANRMGPQQECTFRVFVTSNLLKYSLLPLVMVEELVTLLNTELPFHDYDKGEHCIVLRDGCKEATKAIYVVRRK